MPQPHEIDQLIDMIEQLLAHAEGARLSLRRAQQELSADMAVLREELDRLRAQPRPRPSDRRTSHRARYEHVCVYVAPHPGESAEHEGWVIDYSEGGLCLLVDHDFSRSQELALRPVAADPNYRWVKVQVRYCHPEGDQWKIGCEFADRQEDRELQAFAQKV